MAAKFFLKKRKKADNVREVSRAETRALIAVRLIKELARVKFKQVERITDEVVRIDPEGDLHLEIITLWDDLGVIYNAACEVFTSLGGSQELERLEGMIDRMTGKLGYSLWEKFDLEVRSASY